MPPLRTTLRHRPRSVGVLAWLRLVRVHQKVERTAMEHLRQWNVSVPQFDILAHVGAAEGITQQELAVARLTTKANLSQLLDHMEQDGILPRARADPGKQKYSNQAACQSLAVRRPAAEPS